MGPTCGRWPLAGDVRLRSPTEINLLGELQQYSALASNSSDPVLGLYGGPVIATLASKSAVLNAPAPAWDSVLHQATSVPARERSASSASSRVRIDSLYVERAGPWDERHIAQAAHSHDVSRRYMEQARHCRPTGWRAWRG